ncbi:HEAT repeat domain-containing protein [Providencia rettgeri]|uniref:HEAT repeat domain-containing protein n=1 Tax=Providencia TaxID=586 RepID=UPI000807AFC9|nr:MULTISPECIES: HEAT repeat domain-containing protein [Providencia]ELR5297276.1 HEAT repeat domain-containing protein [Providencia rettgeri]MBQ0396653.1 HEAT repeat domain-containing protein [Providencia rettgeri]MCL0014196.1 HEAT repeat domain-containing protein [Providencia rettgeri]MCX9126167.1 HEAT repeat domain-containing protein [Providencia rettgeri]MCX9130473.1 HEAT repeat domain-containing protein [Providencia rettgeri]
MDNKVINTLLDLTKRKNDDVKIAAISALGDCKIQLKQHITINRLLELCNDPNKDVAISAIKAISKLSNEVSNSDLSIITIK